MRLLLVEDNDELSRLLVKSLGAAAFVADTVTTAAEALDAVENTPYSAVILDLGLPDDDGLVVLHRLRNAQNTTPVIVLTARDGVRDRVAGLTAGADDYLAKPFAIEELVARLEAILRRPGQLLERSLTLGNMVFESVSRQLFIDGAPQVKALESAGTPFSIVASASAPANSSLISARCVFRSLEGGSLQRASAAKGSPVSQSAAMAAAFWELGR